MSRGGRGGFGGGAQNKLPFDIDPSLEQQDIYSYDAGGEEKKEVDLNALFPPYPGGVPRAPPLTKKEKERVAIRRKINAAAHAHPLYTGPRGSAARLCGNKRSAAEFNPFEDQPTYGKKYQKKEFTLPDSNFKNYKWQAPHLFPKELWDTIGYHPDKEEDPNAPKKKLVIAKKTNLDKLARFDDDADDTAAGAEDEDENANADEDEVPEDEPQDDDFEEDEDDNDDYNAEQYFDGGEEDYDEAGGDEGADDGVTFAPLDRISYDDKAQRARYARGDFQTGDWVCKQSYGVHDPYVVGDSPDR